MQIDERLSNEMLMEREFNKYERHCGEVKRALDEYYRGNIDRFELASVLKELAAELATAATLYKIAELAYQLEQKYGRE